MMPDMFTFELDGHDDTIVLWGGAGHPPLVSCTLGKDLGTGFRRDVWTRRSTRCAGDCAQCEAVHVPGMRFDADMDPAMRGRSFEAFPQVEWDGDDETEFQIAQRLFTDWQTLVRDGRKFTMLDAASALAESAAAVSAKTSACVGAGGA